MVCTRVLFCDFLFVWPLCHSLFAYLISLVVTSQLAAFAFAAGGMVSLYLLVLHWIYVNLNVCAGVRHRLMIINMFHWTVSLISPAASLLRTLLLSLNTFSILCHGTKIPSYPGMLSVYGGPILYLVFQAIFLFIALVWWDSGYHPPFLNREKSRQKHSEDSVDLIPACSRCRSYSR